MTTRNNNASERSLSRRAIERIVAQYPSISQDQLFRLFDYFRREASSGDIARIASNPHIRKQYRALCRDHHINRLKFVDWIFAAIAAALAAVALASFTAGS